MLEDDRSQEKKKASTNAILGVTYPHPASLNVAEYCATSTNNYIANVGHDFIIPPTHVETATVGSWGSNGTSYPSDEQSESLGKETESAIGYHSDMDDAPFDEMCGHASKVIVFASDSMAQTFFQIKIADAQHVARSYTYDDL